MVSPISKRQQQICLQFGPANLLVLQIAKNCSGNGKSRVTKFDINMDTIKHHLSFYKLQPSWQDQKKKQNASFWKDHLCLQSKFNINYIGILNFSLKNLYYFFQCLRQEAGLPCKHPRKAVHERTQPPPPVCIHCGCVTCKCTSFPKA